MAGGLEVKPPSAGDRGGLGARPLALGDFAIFFYKKIAFLGIFILKIQLLNKFLNY